MACQVAPLSGVTGMHTPVTPVLSNAFKKNRIRMHVSAHHFCENDCFLTLA